LEKDFLQDFCKNAAITYMRGNPHVWSPSFHLWWCEGETQSRLRTPLQRLSSEPFQSAQATKKKRTTAKNINSTSLKYCAVQICSMF